MHRRRRLVALIGVLVGMSLLTWWIDHRYWYRASYRVVEPGILYVADDVGADMVRRFRMRYGSVTVVDLRSEEELAAGAQGGAGESGLAPGALSAVYGLPTPPGSLPELEQALEFLRLCGDPGSRPVILFSGRRDRGSREPREAALEAAYHVALRKEPVEAALRAAGLAGTRYEAQTRQLLHDVLEPTGPGRSDL